MSKDFKSSEDPKSNPAKKAILIILPVIAVILAGYYFTNNASSDQSVKDKAADVQAQAKAQTQDAQKDMEEDLKNTEDSQDNNDADPSSNKDDLDVEAALSERSIGSDDAGLVIHEYSSLSCNHCATFHNETLGKIKENFVDKGKVKFVFHDFPINKQALYASVISRCMPQDKYYNYLQLLFETQEQWAFTNKFAERLTQSAKMAGLSEERIDACFSSEKLQQGLMKQFQEAQNKHNIRSTPTFIFGDGDEVVTGARSYEFFEKRINEYLQK